LHLRRKLEKEGLKEGKTWLLRITLCLKEKSKGEKNSGHASALMKGRKSGNATIIWGVLAKGGTESKKKIDRWQGSSLLMRTTATAENAGID